MEDSIFWVMILNVYSMCISLIFTIIGIVLTIVIILAPLVIAFYVVDYLLQILQYLYYKYISKDDRKYGKQDNDQDDSLYCSQCGAKKKNKNIKS